MKRYLFILLVSSVFVCNLSAQEHRRYALIWNDEFDSNTLDRSVWSKIWRSKANWAIHMSSHDTLYAFDDGALVLRGMYNDFLPKDEAPFLTGGVWSKDRKSFGFGRIEVRAKFDVAQGFWPAIWMLPQVNKSISWPHGGEIDIMEHFHGNPYVNHTVHSHYTQNLGKRSRPPRAAYPAYNEGEYNTYGMERFQDSLVFFVNGRRTFRYPRYRKGIDGQFPFSNQDYYLILDAQLGQGRSPKIDTARLPVELRVDYVRYYELDTETDVIPEPNDYQQYTTKRYKYKKMVVDEKETFGNPDEYHIVTRRGKATVSGNALWAQHTLTQLVGEDGRIANVDFYDRPVCPYRGISLDRYNKKLSINEINKILEAMSFYKLNYLQWSNLGIFSEEEVDALREHARDLGVTLVTDIPTVPDLDLVDFEGKAQLPAASQVFLQTASKQGGWLFLRGMAKGDLEVMEAFSERYWRGGGAGEGIVENGLPDVLSPAGSRLANFMEKVAVHGARFHF